jgi:hypothetical protein
MATRGGAETAARAAQLAQDALFLTERADILLDGVTVSTYPEFTGDTVFRVVFKNFGRTRGNRVEISASLSFVPEVTTLVKDDRPRTSGVLGAGKTSKSAFHLIRDRMTEETFESITQGNLVLRFEAEARYFDVFGAPHHTKCSGTFMPDRCSFRIDHQEAN